MKLMPRGSLQSLFAMVSLKSHKTVKRFNSELVESWVKIKMQIKAILNDF